MKEIYMNCFAIVVVMVDKPNKLIKMSESGGVWWNV
jgi:hypothetical protein